MNLLIRISHIFSFIAVTLSTAAFAQLPSLDTYNIVWNSQSKNAGESMPCGGGDIGLNVWVEDGDLLLYMSRSGAFDENNMFPKLGRIRLQMNPNPLAQADSFRQVLKLKEGYIEITAKKGTLTTTIQVWVDVFQPVIHLDVNSSQPVTTTATYETWRTEDQLLPLQARSATSFKTMPDVQVICTKDKVAFDKDKVLFYHRNRSDSTIFDFTVHQQGMDSVKTQLWNPIKNLTFGGVMQATGMRPAGTTSGRYANTNYTGWKLQSNAPSKAHQITLLLHVDQTDTYQQWYKGLEQLISKAKANIDSALTNSRDWWQQYWGRSHIFINADQADPSSAVWQVGRNYQLFRYMLGCNAYGAYPTKFNGGFFTYDPVFVSEEFPFSPDFRRWGGGTFTAQNQRLVYGPMLKSGDFDMMKPQFDFYLRPLHNAEIRSNFYWGHEGANFTEQLENFGFPQTFEYNATEYIFGTKRPAYFDQGLQFNNWLSWGWDTVLEFCLMILDVERFSGQDITRYIPLIESSLAFFDQHYQQEHLKRSVNALDADGHLVLYPGSAAETYKTTYNAVTTVAGLKTVLTRLLELPEKYLTQKQRAQWTAMLRRIPPISFRQMQGHQTIAPAVTWERINNEEIPQLYPVYPYGIYGMGKPDLEVAINTWKYDTTAQKFKSHIGWKQDNIFCARMGLTAEAANITVKKLQDSGRRFPAFWGPGFDWVPDHNWGGSGMIGLQEMLMQTDGKKIYLFPAWPKSWDTDFKLHAPYNTTIEGVLKDGQIISLKVSPASRQEDVEVMLHK